MGGICFGRRPTRRPAKSGAFPTRPDMGALRERVFTRDYHVCLASAIDADHRCGGPFGPVQRDDRRYREALTLEHVRLEAGGARRDDERFCVTLCWRANIEHWGSTTIHRESLNDYLDARYPDRRLGIT